MRKIKSVKLSSRVVHSFFKLEDISLNEWSFHVGYLEWFIIANRSHPTEAPYYNKDEKQWYWRKDIYCNKCMSFNCPCKTPTYGLPK